MAVPVFMIITGYVSALSFEKHRIIILYEAFKLKEILRKIIRYTIPYLCMYFLEVGGIIYADKIDSYNLVYLFFTGGIGPGSYYYPIMVQSIFVIPFIYFIVRKYDSLGLIIALFINVLYEILKSAYGMSGGCYRLLIFRYIFAIAAGCWIFINSKRNLKPFTGFLFILIGALYIIGVCYFNYIPFTIPYWSNTSWVSILFVMPIIYFLLKQNIRNILLESLGKATFNIFLVQMVYYGLLSGRFFTGKILLLNIIICIFGGMIFYTIESRFTKVFTKKVLGLSEYISPYSIEKGLDRFILK